MNEEVPWQEEQFPKFPPGATGDAKAWHTWQAGAETTGEAPEIAWQFAQSALNSAESTPKWTGSRNGTWWLGAPGPVAWHVTDACSVFEYEAEKQEGAAGSGGVRPCVKSWQTLQAEGWFKAFLWDGT